MGLNAEDPFRKLRMAPRESAEELARRLEREQRIENRQREFGLEQLLAPFPAGSVRYLNAVPLARGLEDEVIFETHPALPKCCVGMNWVQ